MNHNKYSRLFTVAAFAMVMNLAGCSGDDGTDVNPATLDDLQNQLDNLAAAQNVGPESCVICHSDGSIALSGAEHQADYDQYYQDQVLRVINLSYAYVGGNDVVTFEMTKKNELTGVEEDFDCTQATTNPEPDQSDALSIYFVQYDDTARTFFNPSDGSGTDPDDDRLSIIGQADPAKQTANNKLVYLGSGVCESTKVQTTFGGAGALGDLSLLNGHIAVYGRDETLDSIPAKHIANPKFPFATILQFGTELGPDTYVSNANSEACEACHTKPFLKHAYIYGEVADGTNNDGNDFYVCKSCHLDNGSGGHQDWQLLADDPARYAELEELAEAAAAIGNKAKDSIPENMTAEEKAKYAYKTRLMNDVHMAHSMEFGFPQSMKNCNTCHAGKLATTLADENFTAETCISCHAIDNLVEKMSGTAAILFHDTFITDLDIPSNADNFKNTDCSAACHKDGGYAPRLSKIHNGYDPEIYADATTGKKYSEAFVVTVDEASLSGNILTIKFHAEESPDIPKLAVTDIVPTVMVGLYGYNTKHYIIGPHNRDFDDNGDGVVGERNVDSTNLEYTVGDEHPRFTTVSAAAGAWVVTADLSAWADKIADGIIKRAEIGVMPALDDANGDEVAMNAPSRTFDLGANDFDDTYFPDVVDVMGGCNNCHDALATSFHSGKRGGNIKICKMCHVPSAGGSHLEMQSRSIDSYVHAIHSFQDFDIGDIDFSDPVEALEHQHKINSEFPKFGILDCEACHNEGTYGVPDQSRSLPSVHSGSDPSYKDFTKDGIDNPTLNLDRNIGTVPAYVMGPASRACGACHRAQMINADDANKLAGFNQHVKVNGYLVEDDDGIWDVVVEKIMSMF